MERACLNCHENQVDGGSICDDCREAMWEEGWRGDGM